MFDLMSILFIIIIILTAVIGYFKGFFSLLLSIAKGIIATLIASFLSNPLGSLIYSTGLGNTISNKVETSLIEQNEVYAFEITEETDEALMNVQIQDAINSFKVPSVIKRSINNIIEDRSELAEGETTTIGKIVGHGVGDFVCTTIAFVLLVLALFIVLCLVQRLFRNVNIIPIVGPLNRFLGGALGIVLAFMVIGLCCYIISFIITLPGEFPQKLSDLMGVTPGMERNSFARFCYDYNALRWVYRLMF